MILMMLFQTNYQMLLGRYLVTETILELLYDAASLAGVFVGDETFFSSTTADKRRIIVEENISNNNLNPIEQKASWNSTPNICRFCHWQILELPLGKFCSANRPTVGFVLEVLNLIVLFLPFKQCSSSDSLSELLVSVSESVASEEAFELE
jgi:hypothetical protein